MKAKQRLIHWSLNMDSNLSSRCLSLDLEVGKQDRRIHAFAAVRLDVDQPLVFHDGDLAMALADLRDEGVTDPLPERLRRILRSIARDGRGEEGGTGSIGMQQRDAETVQVTLRREWSDLEELASRRRDGAKLLLNHLLACLPGRCCAKQ